MSIIHDYKAINERCGEISTSIMGPKQEKTATEIEEPAVKPPPFRCATCADTGILQRPWPSRDIMRCPYCNP